MTSTRKYALFLLLFVWHTAALCTSNTRAGKPQGEESKILIINSYHSSFRGSKTSIEAVCAAFPNEAKQGHIYVEHLNLPLISTPSEWNTCQYAFFEKYKELTPNVILFLGNSSWALLKDPTAEKWIDTPAILCAESDYIGSKEAYIAKRAISIEERVRLQDLPTKQGLTVLHKPYFIDESMMLMQSMITAMDTLIFISDGDYTATQNRNDLRAIARYKYPKLMIKDWIADEMTTDALIDSLKNTQEKTGVLFQSWSSKKTQPGNQILASEIVKLLSSFSAAPLFTLNNPGTDNNGLIGCYAVQEKEVAINLTQTISQILNQQQTSRFEMKSIGQPAPMLNKQELTKTDLSTDKCPENTFFYMRSPTVWQNSKRMLILNGLFTIALLAGVCTLWRSGLKKCRDEKRRISKSHQSLIENMPMGYAKHRLVRNEEGQIINYVVVETNSLFEQYFQPEQVNAFIGSYSQLKENQQEIKFGTTMPIPIVG